ncbi:MAG: hypothetical protein ACRD4V_08435 [Candidatus Acidiferrales bacterium]
MRLRVDIIIPALSPKWAMAVEEYSDAGPLKDFLPTDQESHELWGVFDHAAKFADIKPASASA